MQLPVQFIRERYFLQPNQRSPFCRNATVFQDIVIRCVRFAFARIPASIGRVFFSKWVAHPFFRFRLLRQGFLHSPIFYQEVEKHGVKGIWAISDQHKDPDVIIYYCHGKKVARIEGAKLTFFRRRLLYGVKLFLSRVPYGVDHSPERQRL